MCNRGKQKKTTVVLPGEEPLSATKPTALAATTATAGSRANLATAITTMAVGAGAGVASIAAATTSAIVPQAAPVTANGLHNNAQTQSAVHGSAIAVAPTPAGTTTTKATQVTPALPINVSTSVPVDPTKPMFNDVRRESLSAGAKWSPGQQLQQQHQQQQTQTMVSIRLHFIALNCATFNICLTHRSMWWDCHWESFPVTEQYSLQPKGRNALTSCYKITLICDHHRYYEDERTNGPSAIGKFSTQANSSSTTSITHSNTELNQLCHHSKSSNMTSDGSRRVSVQMTSSLKGNFVVSQSDLWDTHTLSHAKQHQRQSPRVSEKNRSKHRHKQQHKSTACQSETDSEREQRDYQNFSSSICSTAASSTATVSMVGSTAGGGGSVSAGGYVTPTKMSSRRLTKSQHSHHHSTPNVAPGMERAGTMDRKHRMSESRGPADGSMVGAGGGGAGSHISKHRKKEGSASKPNLYGACSESELLDGETAILPIFRKLLNEKESRYRARNVVGASCPNISIKCDIVEYL
ncbi:hypothetical protein ZHAS_00014246 [Anopheles sinensis]|uniref:Uncharacterized protein n=1 Tax=Anopheles sinensis TaxID=74873 RepID=A0A084W7R9_ANOSI|nr:hypothetical protein ZHAS_00014246 [Anopheles sinensis]